MNMNNDESQQTDINKPDTIECAPGCNCNASGLSTKGKVAVCLFVALAAAAVLANGIMNRSETENAGGQQAFATSLSTAGTEEPVSFATATTDIAGKEKALPSLWGNTLDSLASLNNVAADKDAVFVFLPYGSDEEVDAIKAQIETAAGKIMSQGTTMAAFTLDSNSQDYALVSSQAPVPCVLTMVKGLGMSVVSKDITEAKLLEALVLASRPSTCGPAAGSSCCP